MPDGQEKEEFGRKGGGGGATLNSSSLVFRYNTLKGRKKRCGQSAVKCNSLTPGLPVGRGQLSPYPGLNTAVARHLEDDVQLQIKVTRLNHSQMDLLFLRSGVSTHLRRL